jgi:hypothetical protein
MATEAGIFKRRKEGARGVSSPELLPSQGACHCLRPLHLASRSPVKASRRLSAFGLDGTRPRCRQTFPLPGNGRRSLHALNSVALSALAHFALDSDRLSHGRTYPLSDRLNSALANTWRSREATNSAPMRSSRPSVRVAWERCTALTTRSSNATLRSKFPRRDSASGSSSRRFHH